MTLNLFGKRAAKRGFTLVDIMITVAVTSLILAVSLPIFSRIRQNAEATRDEADLRTIWTGITMFYAGNGRFPQSYDELRPYADVPRMEERFEINFAALG